MPVTLEEALQELKNNLEKPILVLQEQENGDAIQEDIRKQAKIILEVVQSDLEALNDNDNDRKNPREKKTQLLPLYKRAYYIEMITTLNSALQETDPTKEKDHAQKLKNLGDISTPILKAALYALASHFIYIAALVTASLVPTLIALAPATYGVSLIATVPVSMAARKMQKKGDDFFSEIEKHSNDAWAIKETREKINEVKKNNGRK